MIAVGDNAPGFTLPDELGREVSSSFEGAQTVLVFYRGDW